MLFVTSQYTEPVLINPKTNVVPDTVPEPFDYGTQGLAWTVMFIGASMIIAGLREFFSIFHSVNKS